jgi:acyl dehydratase
MPSSRRADVHVEHFVSDGHPRVHYRGRIDPDAALAYALATNDPNAAYVTGDAVPPVLTASLIAADLMAAEGYDAVMAAIEGMTGGVHGQHDLRLHRPLRKGMDLRWTAHVHAARQTAAGVLVTVRARFTDAGGAPLAEHLWSSLYLDGTLDEFGPDIPDHRMPPRSGLQLLGRHAFEIAPDQGFRFAGASGDRVGHSVDDEVARAEGFPGKILQGLCTLSMCTGAVVKIGAGGDPDRVRRFAGRFSAPLFPRQTLLVDVYDAGTTDDGATVLAFEASAGERPVVTHGRAELFPAGELSLA